MAGGTTVFQDQAKKTGSGHKKTGMSRGSLKDHVLVGVSAENPNGFLIPAPGTNTHETAKTDAKRSNGEKEKRAHSVPGKQEDESHTKLPAGPEAANGFFYNLKID